MVTITLTSTDAAQLSALLLTQELAARDDATRERDAAMVAALLRDEAEAGRLRRLLWDARQAA